MANEFSFDALSDNLNDTFKKGKINKGTIFIIAAVVVAVIALFLRKPKGPAAIEAETIPDVELATYPNVQDNFANFSAAIQDQVQSSLGEFYTDIGSQVNKAMDENNKYTEDLINGIEKQLGTDKETLDKKTSAGWTVGYGTTGTGNPNAGKDYRTDRNALKEEIDRTMSVISYRESKGLDNTSQNNWLNKLRTY